MKATEWLINQIYEQGILDGVEQYCHIMMEQLEKKANEIFEDQMADAYMNGKNNGMDISHPLSMIKEISFYDWYNDNYETKHGDGISQQIEILKNK